jgi:hypothetical protein
MGKTFSIIIPNYNGREFLKDCLSSIQAQTFKDYEVVVVDDASTDDSIGYIQANYPAVKIVRLIVNSAFSKAVNQGIRQAQGEYIFILNNDTVLDKNCLEELDRAIKDNPGYDLFACKILSMSDRFRIDSAGEGYSAIGNPYKIGYRQKDGERYSAKKEVFGACAAASVYHKGIFDDVGGFDEDFVYYNEDSDLNFRARLRGYKCYYVPQAVVYHKFMGTSRRNMGKVTYHICRNKVNIVIKNLPTSLIIRYMPLLIFGRGRDLFVALKKGKFISGAMGLVGALRQMPLMLKKRKMIQAGRKISNKELERLIDWKII